MIAGRPGYFEIDDATGRQRLVRPSAFIRMANDHRRMDFRRRVYDDFWACVEADSIAWI